jgi:hypothetical protein
MQNRILTILLLLPQATQASLRGSQWVFLSDTFPEGKSFLLTSTVALGVGFAAI